MKTPSAEVEVADVAAGVVDHEVAVVEADQVAVAVMVEECLALPHVLR